MIPQTTNTIANADAVPLAVDAKQLGATLGMSTRKIRSLDASGRLPKPVRIGANSVRWVLSEIELWLAAGAPDRCTWETLRRNEKPEK